MTASNKDSKTTDAKTSKTDPVLSNTKLHTAIDLNQTTLALQYIKEDAKKELINAASLGNTPLLLALRKGNMRIAEELCAHPDVNIFAKDGRGLTALHWACMLRQNKIIDMLLKRGADPHLETPRWVDSDITEPFPMTPFELYNRDVLLRNFELYYCYDLAAYADRTAPTNFKKNYSPFFITFFHEVLGRDKVYAYFSGFSDRKDLHIPGEMAYTDIIFHMKDLCENLNWKNNNTKFFTGDSGRIFEKNFIAGIKSFCASRNAIPVDPNLIDQMKNKLSAAKNNKK